PRTDDEDWRQTNVSPLGSIAFEPGDRSGATPEHPVLEALPPAIVLVNGRAAGAPRGASVEPLAEALASRSSAREPHLGRVASDPRHPFVALNTALFEDGALVTIDRGSAIDAPIHIVHVARPGAAPVAAHPRTLVLAGPGSRGVVV